MISIQTAMFVGLGFLIASLLVVLLTPAYRARTVRLTSERIRASLPTTEAELRADKDRIRADSAIRIHRLESHLDKLRFDASRQMVEVGRRDGQINSLSGEIATLRSELDAAQNARNVLEQTIADRLPKVEQRLIEAKKLLFQRDREIAALTQDAERTQQALVEAVQINAQQAAEMDRMHMVIGTRAAQNRDGLADATFDAELALRSEIEALRARTRDQASMLERLQAASAGAADEAAVVAAERAVDDPSLPEVIRLQRDLVRAETALKAMKDVASAGQIEQSQQAAQLRDRDQKIEDQAREIKRLAASLAAFEEAPADSDRALSIKDSKIAMKSKISGLAVQVESQAETIRKLRAEVAASNEKLARQAQHFMEEMRRLGAGTLPASGQARRPAAAMRRTLTQKISEAKPALAAALVAGSRPVLVKTDTPAPAAVVAEPAQPARAATTPEPEVLHPVAGKGVAAVNSGEAAPADQSASAADTQVDAEPPAPARPAVAGRPRLMDRITDYGKV